MFSRLHSFLTAWTRRERFEDSLDEEVRFHLDAYAEDLVRSGVPGREARRRARIHFGSVEGMKDGCRHVRGLRIADELERLMAHIRLAARMLVKTPIVTSVAVVSLALGIGANAAIFSLYSQFLLRPLPVVEPERLVNLEAPGPKPGSDFCNGAGGCDEVFSYPMFRDLQREQTVFTDVAAHRGFIFSVAWRGRSLNVVEGMQVSGSYFPALGLVPALGRLFGPEIDEPIAGHPVAVVSHEFWQDELGGARNALGEVLLVNGEPLTFVGVAPAGFRGTTVNMPSAIFVPLTMNGRLNRFADEDRFEDRRNYWLYLFARLKPQVSIDQARAAVAPLYRSILTDVEVPLQTDMSDETLARFVAKPLPIEDGRRGQSGMHDSVGAPLLLLLGVTGVVLLIACANIANLLLARSAARASEMAVRLSLGATRRHLVTQLLTESCLLAVLGGAAGLVGAKWTLDFIMGALLPPEIAEFLPLQIDPYAIPFTGAVSLATGLLFGTFPAFHGTRAALVSALKDDAGQPAGARSAAGFRRGLVTAQFALATMLLVVAGLFIQSLRNVSGVELGIRTQDVVTFRLWPGLNGYSDERANALYTRLEAELAAQPGVTATTAASIQVLAGDSWGTDVMVEGFEAGPDTNRSTRFNQVGTDYFRTLGIPLLAGRTFTESDARESPPVALVNEAFARKFNLGRDAVGRRLGRGGLDAELDTEIVGLVADARYSHVKSPAPPLLYVPYRQEDGVGTLAFYARSSLPPEGMLRTIPALVAGVDPTLPVTHLTTLPRQVEESAFEDRTITVLSAAFAGLATLLAAVGLYGVLAYTVAQRTREFGLRMALGADAARLRAMVLRQVGRMTLVGGAVGIVAAVGVGRLAQSLLYEIDGLTPAVAGAAALALAAVALGAGFVPVHRASRVDPMNALRHR